MKTKIRFLNNTLEGGGAERVLVNLLKMMPEDKYDISLVTVTGGVFAKEIPDHVKYHQIIKGHSAISKLLTKLIYKMPPKIFDVLFLPGRMVCCMISCSGCSNKCRSSCIPRGAGGRCR